MKKMKSELKIMKLGSRTKNKKKVSINQIDAFFFLIIYYISEDT